MNNIFQILRIGKKELYHNRMLDWLFNLNDGQNDFVIKLFNEIGIKSPTIIDIRSEYTIEGESEEDRRIPDFIIISDKDYIVIENKVRMSSISHQQLEEENKFGRYQAKLKNLSFNMILISPNKITGPTLDIVTNLNIHSLTWSDILNILKTINFDNDLSLLINHYVEHWEDDILKSFKGFDLEIIKKFEDAKEEFVQLKAEMRDMFHPFYELFKDRMAEILSPEHNQFNFKISPSGDWIQILYYNSTRTHFEWGVSLLEEEQYITLDLENANIRQEIYEELKKNETNIKNSLGNVEINNKWNPIREYLPLGDIDKWEDIIYKSAERMKEYIETLKPTLDKLDIKELEPIKIE